MICLIIIAFLAQQGFSLPTNTSSCWGNFCTCLGDYITKLVEQKINDKNIDSSERIPFQCHAKDDPFAPYHNEFLLTKLPFENNNPISVAPITQSVDNQINKLNYNQEKTTTDETKSEISKALTKQSHQIYSNSMERAPTVNMYCACPPKTIPFNHYFNCTIETPNITKPEKPKTKSDSSGASIVKAVPTSVKENEEKNKNKNENVCCNNFPLKGISLYLSGKSPCYYTCCHCPKHCVIP